MQPASIDLESFTSEEQMLLCCARTQMDNDYAARLEQLLQTDLDWEQIIRIAYPQDILPLLYWHLKAYPDGVPGEILSQLQAHFQDGVHRTLVSTRELLAILGLFEDHDIKAMPFKGVVLAQSVYHNISLRPASDMDILVKERDVSLAKEVLLARGYQMKIDVSPAQEKLHMRHAINLPFVRGDPHFSVEIHWQSLSGFFGVRSEMLPIWERNVEVPLGDTRVSTLSPENLLIALCLHGYRHCWERLKWVCDVSELVRSKPDLDWDWVIITAERIQARRILWLGLDVARQLLGAQPPNEILSRMASDPAVSGLTEQVSTQIFDPGYRIAEGFHRMPFYLGAKEGFLDKLRLAVGYLFIGGYLEYRLPGFLSPLYYVFRPIQLAGKGLTRLGGRLR